jgi:hypothetical protein
LTNEFAWRFRLNYIVRGCLRMSHQD